ncbi:MAG: linear amide C-N hydrolase [Burkholderiales bacterium]|nr:linear amide C-N hydrolase [Burkholderiales bacterium]
MRKLILALAGITSIQTSMACTAINIQAKDGTVIAGRTMEWAYNMKWIMLFYPKNSTYYLSAPDSNTNPKVKMNSKYAVLAIGSQLTTDALVEGQNSAGVAVSGNFFPEFSQYQTVSKSDKHYVSVIEFTRFLLSNYGSVAEAKANLPQYKVWLPNLTSSPAQATMHFMISDKTGADIVIEFVGGQMKIYDKTPGVLTNSPTYDWQLTNIRNYINLTNEAVGERAITTLGDITNVSQGGGGIGLPGDYMSPSRFVRAIFLKNYSDKPANEQEAISLTTHILDTVDIPKGAVSSKDADGTIYSDTTQWVAIKDLSNNLWYFSDYDHRGTFVKIDINKLDKHSKGFALPLEKIQYPVNDITASLVK